MKFSEMKEKLKLINKESSPQLDEILSAIDVTERLVKFNRDMANGSLNLNDWDEDELEFFMEAIPKLNTDGINMAIA